MSHWRIKIQKFPAHAPLLDPILSFSHAFSLKSARVRGQRPLTNPRPPMGNPGSATVNEALLHSEPVFFHELTRCPYIQSKVPYVAFSHRVEDLV